ncbi:MAG TPA: hypothetical protein VGF48_17275 [Thermoanaerobaculia bacterium]|jgi:photosystem II stability/assembly factor-like uncharacterized protein
MIRSLTPLALALTLAGCVHAPEPLREDGPDHAATYAAMKRQGSADPQGEYERARITMRRMPQYSTASDSLIERDRMRINAEAEKPFGKWQFLGPGNIGGRTRALVIDAKNPRLMYAGGVSGGVWRSNNAGETWTPVGDALSNIAVNSLALHPNDPNVLYAGTGEGFFREEQRGTALPLRGAGIFLTRDGGHSWQRLPSTVNENFHWVNDLVISTHEPSRIYAATRTGVWRSSDSGATWKRIVETSVKGGCLELAWRGDTTGDYLFASCGTFEQATVYRNTNAQNDDAWEPVLSEPKMGRTSLAIAPSNPSVVYAMAASNETGAWHQGLLAVYRSDASGDAGSWTTRVTNKSSHYLSTLLLTNPYGANVDKCQETAQKSFVTMGWYCNVLAVDPKDPNRVWAAGVDLFRSDDGGATWGVASYWWAPENRSAFNHADQHAIVFHPNYDGVGNQTVYFGNDGGLYRSDNARAAVAKQPNATCDPALSSVAFTRLNRNYGVTQFYHGAVYPDGRRFVGGTQDNGTIRGSIEDSDAWTRILGGDGAYVAIDPRDENVIYAESQFGALRKSADGGKMWVSLSSQLKDNFLFVTPFLLDPNDANRLWIGGEKMWRSDNGGLKWTIASATMASQVSAIAVAPGKANRVIAGTNSGVIVRSDAALSATSSSVWTSVTPREGFVTSIAYDPFNADIVYATYAGFGGPHVWMSTDAGATWTARDGEGDAFLPDIPTHSIVPDPTRPDRLYLGTDLGVFVSLDRGKTWAVENSGFTNVVTEALVIAKGVNGPAVYAFTHGRGVWRTELVAGKRRRSVR